MGGTGGRLVVVLAIAAAVLGALGVLGLVTTEQVQSIATAQPTTSTSIAVATTGPSSTTTTSVAVQLTPPPATTTTTRQRIAAVPRSAAAASTPDPTAAAVEAAARASLTAPTPTMPTVAYVAPTVTDSWIVSCTSTAPGAWRVVYSVTLTGGQGWRFFPNVVTNGSTGTFTLESIGPADPPPPPYAKEWTIGSAPVQRTSDYREQAVSLSPNHVLTAHCTS